jgi:hypothetical protein
VEIIPVKLNAIPVVTEKCSASSPQRRSPCHRNRVHLRTGMPFTFLPESRSDSTGFLKIRFVIMFTRNGRFEWAA